ncbi:uncharacterized protein LOC134215654 [Armigeres subalbatus]|uniref:uncharacterized protein LOC134215654 n=1 Tax=Armigeres subalbatus TaxID=124917 RepID=UPI002ED100B9
MAEMDEVNINLPCFLKFIESRSFALQSAQTSRPKASVPYKPPSKAPLLIRGASAFVATNSSFCDVCHKQNHQLYQCGGFHLRKWASNSATVLEEVPDEDREVKISIVDNGSSTIKALGMQWQPCSDELHFTYQLNEILQPTKRIILSQIASLFDPLGLLSPIIVKAKLVMQRMWELKVAWDANPPGELINDWLILVQKFSLLNSFQIPRNVIDMRNWTRLYLHGYCDASEVAMGACVYIRAVDDDGNTSSHLLCAKSKLAPIGNGKTTTPRLELCAAVILARLISNVKDALSTTTFYEIRAFSDSKVVLAWLAGGAARWKTFVANRVAEISTHLPSINWYHVGTLLNPADLISREAFPEQLQENILWWHGPSWEPLNVSDESASQADLDPGERRQMDREQRTTTLVCLTVYENRFLDDMMARYYPRLQLLLRITARMLRFRHPEYRSATPLSLDEIDFALEKYLPHTQQKHFSEKLADYEEASALNVAVPYTSSIHFWIKTVSSGWAEGCSYLT